jgi:dUTP pyrophosphatase
MVNLKREMTKIKVKLKQIVKNFPLPAYQTEDASGLDLYAAIVDSISIQPGEIKLIPTGIMLSFRINSGDRIAQLVFNSVIKAEFELAEELDETLRNEDGFGHTGDEKEKLPFSMFCYFYCS